MHTNNCDNFLQITIADNCPIGIWVQFMKVHMIAIWSVQSHTHSNTHPPTLADTARCPNYLLYLCLSPSVIHIVHTCIQHHAQWVVHMHSDKPYKFTHMTVVNFTLVHIWPKASTHSGCTNESSSYISKVSVLIYTQMLIHIRLSAHTALSHSHLLLKQTTFVVGTYTYAILMGCGVVPRKNASNGLATNKQLL